MQLITIGKNNSGVRLDKFLKQEFFSYSRGEIIRNIQEGNILIQNKKVKPSYILKENDIIKVNFKALPTKLISNKNIDFKIIHKDKNIIVINKPAGLKVHPNSFEENNTLANGLLAKFPEIENVNDDSVSSNLRPGIVHRLDRETSGIMVIAKNQKSFDELKKLFQERKVVKKYLAIVSGKLKNKKGVIEKPIARSSSYKKQVIAGYKTKTKSRLALTEYKVIKEFSDFSLVEARPKTGRTHQIRIHFFSLGHPLIGDKKYKFKKVAISNEPERQMLHAKSIEFKLFDRNYHFKAGIPEDFQNFLKFSAKK